MIVVANRIQVAPEYREEFERRFREGVRHIKDAPGFIRNHILRPIRSDYYVVLSYWESQGTFKAWTESEAFQKAHSKSTPEGMFSGPSVMEIHEVIITREASKPA